MKSLIQDLEPSHPSSLSSLSSKYHRAGLITKYDFPVQPRLPKSSSLGGGGGGGGGSHLPPPFTVTTGLTVTESRPGSNRGGRAHWYSSKEAGRKVPIAHHLASALDSAPLIQGVRMPDDASDSVVHRGGRFINNVFIPDGRQVRVPAEFTVRADLGSSGNTLRRVSRSYSNYVEDNDYYRRPSYQFSDFYTGRKQDMEDATAMESRQDSVYVAPPHTETHQTEERIDDEPVYFLSESPDSLHADRSPYTFEPASQSQSSSSNHPAIISATNEDFVIQQHTYQMCPTCPTFSIPIPVPRSTVTEHQDQVTNPYLSDPGYEYQHGSDPSLSSRITTFLSSVSSGLSTSLSSLLPSSDPGSTFSDRLSPVSVQPATNTPLIVAGLAAAGLGLVTMVTQGLQLYGMGAGVARGWQNNMVTGGGGATQFDTQSLLCLPRLYCEKMKRGADWMDQFPNTKLVGRWLVKKLFDEDVVYESEEEQPFYNKCHLRECLMSLLN